jgi:hypothetical protein
VTLADTSTPAPAVQPKKVKAAHTPVLKWAARPRHRHVFPHVVAKNHPSI